MSALGLNTTECVTCNWYRRIVGAGANCALHDAVLTLAHNLAIAAVLCRAFDLGRDLQHPLTNADWAETRHERDRQRAEIFRDYFHPGCGRSAQ